MSFVCQYCKEPQDNRCKPIKVTVETRRVMHQQVKTDRDGNRVRYNTTEGPQIVKEMNLCASCALLEKFGGEG